MTQIDLVNQKKWELSHCEMVKSSLTLSRRSVASSKIDIGRKYNVKIIGRKKSGNGHVRIRVLSKSGAIVFSKKLKFASKSWSEKSFDMSLRSSGEGRLSIEAGDDIFGRVEIGRLMVRPEASGALQGDSQGLKKIDVIPIEYIEPQIKRLAIIVPYGIYGGGEVYLKRLLEQEREKVLIDIIYLSRNNLSRYDLGSGIQSIYAGNVKRLSSILVANDYDSIVYYNSLKVYSELSSLKLTGKIKASIAEVYHSDFLWADAVAKLRTRAGIDMMFRVSDGLANDIKGIKDSSKILIPVGVDTDLYSRSEHKNFGIISSLNIPRDKIIIGTVARLSPEKNINYAISLASRNKAWHLVVVGDGPRRPSLERYIKSNNITNVTLVGHIEDVTEYYNIFDAFMLTSKAEGTPISVLEAMSFCLPVYCTDVGEIRKNYGHLEGIRYLTGDADMDYNIINSSLEKGLFYEDLRSYVLDNNDIKKISEVFFEKLLFGPAEFITPSDSMYILPGEYI